MRVIFAAFFVVVTLGLLVVLLGGVLDGTSPAVFLLVSIGFAILFLVLCVVAFLLFNGTQWRSLTVHLIGPETTHVADAEWIAARDAEGLIVSTEYRASRALQISESEDEGPYFFIELENGDVLFLYGQYLYRYDPPGDADEAEGDSDEELPVDFPCSQFAVRRHKIHGFAVDVLCQGRFLQPEYAEITDQNSDAIFNRILEDGAIITDRSFDEILDAFRR